MSILEKILDPKRVANFVYWRVQDALQFAKNCWALAAIFVRMRLPNTAKPHGRKEEIIVSLTSYEPRFKTLPYTLECLIRQSVKADRIIVWLDPQDMNKITPRMRALEARGVEYRQTAGNNLKSFNKIIPALMAFADAVIVTVDDDIYYASTMLESLLQEWSGNPKEIVCHYAERITVDHAGNKKPFKHWKAVAGAAYPAYDIMPFGFAGVLYPPHVLPLETKDAEAFKRLCHHGDDIWLYWMGRKNGCVYRKTHKDYMVCEWPSSQIVGLKHQNMYFRNEEQIGRMIKEYGWPSFDTP
jgi:hypothetical protein